MPIHLRYIFGSKEFNKITYLETISLFHKFEVLRLGYVHVWTGLASDVCSVTIAQMEHFRLLFASIYEIDLTLFHAASTSI